VKKLETLEVKPIVDTAIYGSYLLPKFCYQLGCTKSEYLVEVRAKACHCGFEKAHTHCKNCGGICSVG